LICTLLPADGMTYAGSVVASVWQPASNNILRAIIVYLRIINDILKFVLLSQLAFSRKDAKGAEYIVG
jgi:hypothetical protein